MPPTNAGLLRGSQQGNTLNRHYRPTTPTTEFFFLVLLKDDNDVPRLVGVLLAQLLSRTQPLHLHISIRESTAPTRSRILAYYLTRVLQ